MVISRLTGGLGNQMFQYAFGKHISIIKNTEHKLDVSEYVFNKPDYDRGIRMFGLDSFNISSKKATEKDLNKYLWIKESTIRRKIFLIFHNSKNYFKKKYILEPQENYLKFDKNILENIKYDDIYLEGYWLSEKYFKNIEKEIRRDFTIKNQPSIENAEYLRKIKNDNSVCVHIRRGDKIKIENGIVSVEYYNKAIKHIVKKTKTPTFFVFSDNIDWAKDNLKIKEKCFFVSHNNKELNDVEDMRLMTACKHHIIGNSSFSWWAAWLGKTPNQIVICPRFWHSKGDLSNYDYVPNGWKLI